MASVIMMDPNPRMMARLFWSRKMKEMKTGLLSSPCTTTARLKVLSFFIQTRLLTANRNRILGRLPCAKNRPVLEVELLNPYNGIDASRNDRHLIRDVQGQPLRRGIFVDDIYDIGRIEDVHFNPWWSLQPTLSHWQEEHGEAFILGTATGNMSSILSATATI